MGWYRSPHTLAGTYHFEAWLYALYASLTAVSCCHHSLGGCTASIGHDSWQVLALQCKVIVTEGHVYLQVSAEYALAFATMVQAAVSHQK